MKRKGVNILMVFRVIGWLLIIESVFMTVPLITTLVYHESDSYAFIVGIIATALTGMALTFCLRPRHTDMGKREGFLLTALVWVMFSFLGMIPFMLCGHKLSISDAFFESMSGFTTTGASVLPSVEALGKGISMWRCLMQWLGGMGIILFTLAVVPMLNHSGGMQMFNAEVTGITHDKIRPRISQTAKGLWGVYVALTLILIALLWMGPMNMYESICHAFSSISTGGYSTADESIAHWDSVYIKVVLSIFMFLGGVNFALMYKAALGQWRALLSNDVLKAYVRIVLGFFLVFILTIIFRGQVTSWQSVTIDPLFQIISTITSTGLSVCDYEEWGPFTLSLLFVLMFFGACAGSTSGGAKIDRMMYLLKNTRNELYRCLHPNTVLSVRVNGKAVPYELVSKVIAFLCIYVMIIGVGGIALTAIGLPMVDSFFSAVSCISNTGLGAGVTGYGESFDKVPDLGKWILSALMLTGRLEIFTVLVLFTKGFWSK